MWGTPAREATNGSCFQDLFKKTEWDVTWATASFDRGQEGAINSQSRGAAWLNMTRGQMLALLPPREQPG